MAKVIVVGGGAAGMMAAYGAAQNGQEVTLIERNEKLGKKVYITGKGRCNVTNNCDTNDFFQNVISNEKFLYSSIYGFDASMVMELFEQNGCPLKIERGERVFPVSDHSSDIISTMEKILKNNKVKIIKNTYVNDLMIDENSHCVTGVIVKDAFDKKQQINADAVILATGGVSYKTTGSDGNGHKLVQKYGHSIVSLRPGLVPLVIQEDICSMLQGLSLKNVALNLKCNGKEIYNGFGEMLFTHFGMSGPLVLSAASYLNKYNKDLNAVISIDLKPALSNEKLDKRILREFDENKNKALKNVLPNMLPGKLASIFPDICGMAPDKIVNSITKEERANIVKYMKELKFHVEGSRGFEEAIITIGGVNVKEINPSTMESKVIKNLYFAGEIIDVDALTGGFNLQIAWSTGYLAGQSACTV